MYNVNIMGSHWSCDNPLDSQCRNMHLSEGSYYYRYTNITHRNCEIGIHFHHICYYNYLDKFLHHPVDYHNGLFSSECQKGLWLVRLEDTSPTTSTVWL